MWKLPLPLRRTMLYCLAFITAIAIAGLLFGNGIKQTAPGIGRKAFFTAVVLLIGISHIFIFPKWIDELYGTRKLSNFVYTLLIAACILVACAFFFNFFALTSASWATTGAIGFLLPTAMKCSWNYLNEMTIASTYKSLVITKSNHAPAQKVSLFLNSVQLNLKLNLDADDKQEKVFSLTAPGRMKIADMFQGFLIDKTAERVQLELLNKNKEAFSWNFSVRRFMGNKMLDPYETISNNGIKQGDIIIARRLN
ncbi:MAG: TssN family type VI secretion system protein [Ferruginibacter sp.]